MLIIYGTDLSSPSNKVRILANYLGLDYEYRRVNLAQGENKTDEFKRLHPAGKVPVIFEDGSALFESNAICKYLAEKNNSKLYPRDLKQRAIIDQWMDFITQHVGLAMGKLFYNKVIAPWRGTEIDQRSLKEGAEFLNQYLPIIEQQLTQNTYVVGPEITLADINLLAVLDPAEAVGVELSKYTKITAWRRALKEQPFYTKCHRDFTDVLKAIGAPRA
jgi:glutathione S-transferase